MKKNRIKSMLTGHIKNYDDKISEDYPFKELLPDENLYLYSLHLTIDCKYFFPSFTFHFDKPLDKEINLMRLIKEILEGITIIYIEKGSTRPLDFTQFYRENLSPSAKFLGNLGKWKVGIS